MVGGKRTPRVFGQADVLTVLIERAILRPSLTVSNGATPAAPERRDHCR